MSATVRVWIIDLDEEPALASTLLACLSGEERVRASRFRTTVHRLRYIVAHGALRHILSLHVGVRPAQVSLATTATGKPFVPGSPLAFNLSHSEGLAICAVTPEGELGADVECIRPIDDADSLVERFFAADERRQYQAIEPRDRVATFYSIWTRKEAFVKATGAGLNRELQSFEVEASLEATQPRLTSLSDPAGRWSLRAFVPRSGYIAAVALDRSIAALELVDWSMSAAGCAHPQRR
jgi:4'-phosphopantetheinyl transferase